MNLGELLRFMQELREGKHPRYNIPIAFEYTLLVQDIRMSVVKNNNKFGAFLSYLYSIYRKIEVKMEKAGYPNILPDSNPEEESFDTICDNLSKLKNDYKSMDKNDILKMYPILKNLFICYTNYIKYSLNNAQDIEEGSYLPGTIHEMRPWLRKLNKWLPIKVNEEWINCMSSFVGAPSGYEEVINRFHKIPKFNDFPVVNDDNVIEPYISRENNKKIFFGFVNMEGAKVTHHYDNSILFESECPQECIPESRRWICSTCGDFVRMKITHTGHPLLLCSCGSKKYKEKFLICHYPTHRLQSSHDNKATLSVPDMKEAKNKMNNPGKLLFSICQKLEEVQAQNKEATDPKILIAIISLLSKNQSKEDIRSALEKLQDVALSEDTITLIKKHLNKNN